MKNMKKLLGAMAALGFSTVAAVNVVACSNPAKSNDLTKSFETSYSKAVTDAPGLAALGLVIKSGDNTKYTFTFANITDAGIQAFVTAKESAPVNKGITVATTLPTPAAEGDEIAQVTQKTTNGDLTVSSDTKKTVSFTVTLKLFKAVKQSDSSLKYVDQSTSMDVTLNIDTVATKIDITDKIPALTDLGALPNTPAEALTAYKTAVVNKLKAVSELSTITDADLLFQKSGTTTAITGEDIITGDTELKIKLSATGNNFTGEKDAIDTTYTIAA